MIDYLGYATHTAVTYVLFTDNDIVYMCFIYILVAPYIEPTKTDTISVTVGDTVKLPCNVLFGHPAPSLKWQFIAPDTTSLFLKR